METNWIGTVPYDFTYDFNLIGTVPYDLTYDFNAKLSEYSAMYLLFFQNTCNGHPIAFCVGKVSPSGHTPSPQNVLKTMFSKRPNFNSEDAHKT